jgi:hypothetical protein
MMHYNLLRLIDFLFLAKTALNQGWYSHRDAVPLTREKEVAAKICWDVPF